MSENSKDAVTIIKEALNERYEIRDLIGTGGMAGVYRAMQLTLERDVAIKVVHQNLVHDKEFIHRFIKEARVAASLNHPNIITIHDVGSIDQVHYMTMEYLDGEPLSKMIRRKGMLGLSEALKIVIPIAQALNYLHKMGYVHRDVKSSNIFITKDGRPVLTDFGIVYTNESLLSQPGTVLGTPEFMSPEQANGKDIDGRSDLYSLGVILYEAITGKMPFRTDNPLTTVFKVINEAPKEPVEHNRKIPTWLNSQVLNLLAKDPEKRVQNGNRLASNLFHKKTVSFNFDLPVSESSEPSQESNTLITRITQVTQSLNIGDWNKGKADDSALEEISAEEKESTSSAYKLLVGLISVVLIGLIGANIYFVNAASSNDNSVSNDQAIELAGNDVDDNNIYTTVDQHPLYPGGISEYYNYIKNNLKYPDFARERGIEGKVMMEFVIEKNGSVGEINVVKGLGSGCDEEAFRLIRELPDFKPGVLDKKFVRVKVVLPVEFVI
ncbi:MAG: TonB family protein [Cyclobacteriaceae bacterium]